MPPSACSAARRSRGLGWSGNRISTSSRSASAARAAQIASKGAPKLSRRWAVTSISWRSSTRGGSAGLDGGGELGVARQAGQHHVQRVDAAIAGDEDLAAQPLRRQIVAGAAGRGEVKIGDQADRTAIIFLRPGRGAAIGAQARLDMGDRDAAVEGGQGRRHGGAWCRPGR